MGNAVRNLASGQKNEALSNRLPNMCPPSSTTRRQIILSYFALCSLVSFSCFVSFVFVSGLFFPCFLTVSSLHPSSFYYYRYWLGGHEGGMKKEDVGSVVRFPRDSFLSTR